jgi:hypothetical protein
MNEKDRKIGRKKRKKGRDRKTVRRKRDSSKDKNKYGLKERKRQEDRKIEWNTERHKDRKEERQT